MVKDHRTDVRDEQHGGVLDGDLDAFMQAELERGDRRATTPPDGRVARTGRPRGDLTYRPGRDRRARGLRRDLAGRDQRLHRPPRPARDPVRDRPPASACYAPPPGDRSGAVRRRPPGRRRHRRGAVVALRRRRSCASACGSCPCCSSGPEFQAAGIGRALLAAGRCRPAATTAGRAGRRRPTAPSRSRTPCTPRTASCPACRCSTCRAARAARGVRAAAVGRRRRCRSRRSPADRPTAPATASLPARSTRSTARCSASRTRVDHRYLRSEARRGWLYRGPGRRGRWATATRPRPVASVRSPCRDAPPGAGPRPPDRGRRSRAAPSPCGCRATRRCAVVPALRAGLPARPVPGPAVLGPPVRRLQPLPADLARPALTSAPDPTGPDHRPVAGDRRPVCRSVGGDSLRPTWLPSPCPRTESLPLAIGDACRRQPRPRSRS